MKRAMTLEEASVTLNRSIRTVQRWVSSGKLESETRDGKLLALIDVPDGEAIAHLQRQADDTGRVAALAAVTGERAAIAYQERADELTRQLDEGRGVIRTWRRLAVASGVAAVATSVALAYVTAEAAATRDRLTDTRAALDASADACKRLEAARERLEGAIVRMTTRDTVADSVTLGPLQ
jgi:hypothetical protein